MSTRTVSPGAALLRSSRMFSMPAPIPGPSGDYSSATKHHSQSATVNFPTHLAVTTPSSSRIVGDWGFKRPLPLRTTTRSTIPLIRVRQVDSSEHVTDFQSASDHTITLKKYQEMNLPMSVPPENPMDRHNMSNNQTSVFEEDSDILALSPEQAVALENKRWKFKGPWLAGMTDGDFIKYLQKVVRNRRPEFHAFLKEKLAAKMTTERELAAREDAAESIPEPVTVDKITEAEFMDELRRLRDERTELYTLVSRFLDLAPVETEFSLLGLGRMAPGMSRDVVKGSPYSATGPPATHPSAGISYLRTRSFQDNHPVYGLQKAHTPVKARILMPRIPAAGNFSAIFGVAGFISETPYGDNVFNTRSLWGGSKGNDKRLHSLELEKRGGAKIYVQPTWATAAPNGTIRILATDSPAMATLIEQEMRGEEGANVYEDHKKAVRTPEVVRIPRGTSQQSPGKTYTLGNSDTYGLNLNSFRT